MRVVFDKEFDCVLLVSFLFFFCLENYSACQKSSTYSLFFFHVAHISDFDLGGRPLNDHCIFPPQRRRNSLGCDVETLTSLPRIWLLFKVQHALQ